MLKRMLFAFLFPLSLFACSLQVVPEASGRLGDRIISFIGTQWLCKYYGIELLLLKGFFNKSCEENLKCKLTTLEEFQRINKGPIFCLEKLKKVVKEAKFCGCEKKVGYGLTYHMTAPLVKTDLMGSHFSKATKAIVTKDSVFLEKLRSQWKLIEKAYEIVTPPKNSISIAIHFREGGDFDSNFLKELLKSRMPNLKFYEQGLDSILSKIPPDYPVFIGVFSDSVSLDFMEDLNNYVKKFSHKVVLKYMTDSNKEPLVDIFQMSHYDFIIRGTSLFSFVSSLLGNPIGSYTYFEWRQPPRLEFEKKRLFKKLKSINPN